MVSTVEAKNGERSNFRKGYMSVYDAEPIQFKERGIKFYIFLDGQFDFNTHPNRYTNIDYAYRTSRRSPRVTSHRGVRIERDYRGRVRRVGNVFINYNRYGKVSRIGKVFIKYNRRHVSKVGGLKVLYNNWGNVKYVGKVKRKFNYFYWDSWDTWEYDYDDDFFFRRNFRDNYESFDEDDDFLYYRSKKSKKGKKGTIIKRKKLNKHSKKRRSVTQ